MKLAVTGGAGFIGSNFIRYFLSKYPSDTITNLDKLTYSGSPENLCDLEKDPRYRFRQVDICDPRRLRAALEEDHFDALVHFAADSHVDRSILNSAKFVKTNVLGTQCLLEAARGRGVRRFICVSTDEVYGSATPSESFREDSPLAPNSPYAASKASGDLLARAYFQTYRFPVVVTRCSNNFGPYQYPEKFVPLLVSRALEDQSIPIYGDGMQVRDWIYVEDHCAALDAVLRRGQEGEVYNIGGGNEWTNLEIACRILHLLGKPHALLTFVQDRPGHDRRYSLDTQKIRREIGWAPRVSFEDGLARTVVWYRTNLDWMERARNGSYRRYFTRQYTRRSATLDKMLATTGGQACASS
jgi:dTDP-glucose 4,6-dehydratase